MLVYFLITNIESLGILNVLCCILVWSCVLGCRGVFYLKLRIIKDEINKKWEIVFNFIIWMILYFLC